MASGKSDKFDVKLVTIAKRTKQDTETDDLGGALGIAIGDRDSAKEENRHGIKHMGTLNMLRDWRKGQHPSEEVENLKDGLRNANLIRLLSEVFPEDDKGAAKRKTSKGAAKRKSSKGTKQNVNDASPGPSTRNKKKKIDNTKVPDGVIVDLAEDIGINPKLDKLGLELGFGFPAMKMYNAMNHADGDVTSKGTKQMLIDWRNKEGQGNASILKKALKDAGFKFYADKYFKDS